MVFLFLIATTQAFADTNLQIGPGSGLDPVQLGPASEVQVNNVNGAKDVFGPPLQVIIGVPNTSSFSDSILSPVNVTSPAKTISLTSGEEVYSALGLSDLTNNSNSFTNWADSDLVLNALKVTNFDVLEYTLTNTDISGKGTVTVDFNDALPLGTYVVAYAADTDGGNPEDVAFTHAGVVTQPVPEPSTVLLLGIGLLGLGLYSRKRIKA